MVDLTLTSKLRHMLSDTKEKDISDLSIKARCSIADLLEAADTISAGLGTGQGGHLQLFNIIHMVQDIMDDPAIVEKDEEGG